ncbi:hypothetical protein B7494_g4209 [Chlorociboria aeruginascens]|nr:hypothetical protein B7494_g4209 [Chlorociboria aeruginascens]
MLYSTTAFVLAAMTVGEAVAGPAHAHLHRHAHEKKDVDWSAIDWDNLGINWSSAYEAGQASKTAAAESAPTPVVAAAVVPTPAAETSAAASKTSATAKSSSSSSSSGALTALFNDLVGISNDLTSLGASYTGTSGSEVSYVGNVGVPEGANMCKVSSIDGYDFTNEFINTSPSTLTVAIWNKAASPGLKGGAIEANLGSCIAPVTPALTFALAPGASQIVAFLENSQIGYAEAVSSIAESGAFATTWGEVNFLSSGSGYDMSAIMNPNGNNYNMTISSLEASCISDPTQNYWLTDSDPVGGSDGSCYVYGSVAHLTTELGGVIADLCHLGSTEISGNWYCQPVKAIQYSNVGAPGSYQQITEMTANGQCFSEVRDFNGPLSPLDEEVSVHFRGPLQLKQFAAYTLSTPNKQKREVTHHRSANHHRHTHQRYVEDKLVKKQEITATIDGQVVSWENNWFGKPVASVTSSPVMVTATIDGQVVSWENNWFGDTVANGSPTSATVTNTVDGQVQTGTYDDTGDSTSAPVPTATSVESTPQIDATELSPQVEAANVAQSDPSTSASFPSDSAGSYERIGYYDSTSQFVDNLVFLGNYGGEGSGVVDLNFGASLAYANCDGTGGSSTPQILADTTIPSDAEVIVMLSQQCRENDCGYVRPGAVAYHGFDGADKLFLMEFSMPLDGERGFNGDLPAIWLLNSEIPRTLQYGKDNCSCWETGCGEFDIAEALHSGSMNLKSTLHAVQRGGDSDFLIRPTSGTMKLAVVFSSRDSTIHIQVLPDETTFSSNLSFSEIDGMSVGL